MRVDASLRLRLLTALVGAPLLIAAIVAGGAPFLVVILATASYGGYELLQTLRRGGANPFPPVLLGLAAGLPLIAAISRPDLEMLFLGFMTFGCFLLALAKAPGGTSADWGLALGGGVLLGGLLRAFVLLRALPDGLWWVLTIVLATWTCDTFAYTVGRLIGRHTLIPRVSPKKTVEGAVAGLVATPIFLVAWHAAGPILGIASPITVASGVALGLVLAASAIVGDLAESLIKRQSGVKDSGVILPGHGGLLDRIDSLLFAGVAGYGASLVLR